MEQAILDPTFHSINKALYDPRIVLDSEEFEILKEPAKVQQYSKSNKNIACCYNEKKQASFSSLFILMVNKPMPKLHPGQVLLHVRATGICGSDVHFWKHAGCGAGHESAGEVIGVGEGVLDVHVGDRVAIEAGVPCSKPTCEMCRTGRYNACPDPLAVALASVEHAGVKLGDPVLICGAGPIGLVTLLACVAAGACPIVITDISESRLDFAKRIVPSVSTFRIVEGVSEPELGQRIQTMMGEKPQVALECTGRQSSVRTAIFISVCESISKSNQIGVSRIDQCQALVTHRFPLEEAVEAFHTSANPESGSIKVQIVDL
ncbi:hypothetical protein KEM48_003071 [Puccinia striiformis f. sp. tritici PST-130]|nr:hypothetical protein KEM48_003071 [Puccinia striiformis f. sp. tritici PST-130]